MPCPCTAMAVTLVVCLKGLPLQFLRRATTVAGCRMCTTSGVAGKKSGMCVPSSPHPTLVPNATTSGTCGAHTVGGCAFCLTTTYCPARGGVTRETDWWVHFRADEEPTIPPVVAHDNGSKTAAVALTPPRPKKECKVRSRADTSMPTTTRTTRSERRNKPPPPKDGGYLSQGDSTPEVHKE